MFRQGRELGMRWHKLILPFLLPIVAVLLLLYLLSPNVTAKLPLLKVARSDEDIHASSHSALLNPECDTCAIFVGTPTPPTQTILPTDSAVYTLGIRNTGNCPGVLTLTPSSHRGWGVDVIPSSPIDSSVGSLTVVTLCHTAPACELSGTMDVAVTTATLNCPSCGDSGEQVVVLTTTVGGVLGVALEPDRFASAAAGETVLFSHTLTNTGNSTDSFWFEAVSTSSWPITLPTTSTVGPSCSTVVPISVAVPLSAEGGQTDTIVVTTTSTSSSTTSDHVIDQIEVTSRCCEVAPGIADPVQSAIPGGTVTYTVTVSNVGAHTGTASIETDAPEDWSPVVLPLTRTLSPGESADWRMSLTVPSDAYPGVLTTHVTAVLTCTATQTDTAPGTVTTTVSTPIAAIEPGTVKTIPVTEDVINNGTVITFTHAFANIGNLADTFTFTIHSVQEHLVPGWSVTRPGLEENVKPNESRVVTFSVTIPPRALTYSDTIIITATPVSAPAHSDTATDRIRDGQMFLPIVLQSFCEVAPLCNGDFETGDLSCWSHSRYDGPNELPTQIGPGLSGNYSALLGDPGFYCWGGVPIGRAWMEQSFIVPNNGNPTLTFTYEIHTQHTIDYDSFEVYLNGHRILKVGYDGIKPGCDGEPIVASDTCTIDLMDPTDCYGNPIDADFRCAQVTLRFENWNRSHNFYNTWTYVDDVEFSW